MNEEYVSNVQNKSFMVYERPEVESLDMASEILGENGSNFDSGTFTQP